MPAEPDVPLSPDDLTQLRQQYSRLSGYGLQQVYTDAVDRCKLDPKGRPPRADQFQVLVTAWKALRALKTRASEAGPPAGRERADATGTKRRIAAMIESARDGSI